VLWDVDYTLVAAPGGAELYRLALAELYGLPLPTGLQTMAGRTDSAIALEVLSRAGLVGAEAEVPRFQAVLARLVPQAHGIVRERGRVLPGAAAAIAALASPAARPLAAAGPAASAVPVAASAAGQALAADGQVIQSLLTGNIPALARLKVSALGLTAHLDLDIGAYGDVSRIRADLVPVARRNAAARYGGDFAGRATVLVGDTPSDIEAAAAHGARSVAVASGQFTAQQLAAAGADAVLADLTDTSAVVSAIVTGRP
jgi:phosphoglycolate phosphatase-like HAD superfamily hydrolase